MYPFEVFSGDKYTSNDISVEELQTTVMLYSFAKGV